MTEQQPTAAPRAIIHVDMDAFYASVEQRDNPALRGQPVIVGGTGRRGVVAAASYEARALGVHSAMPVLRARRLCPDGHYLRPRHAHYSAVSAQIFEIFREFTPLVEGLSLDEAFLDVTGSLRLMGNIGQIGRALKARVLERTGLVASVGLAHNKFLAKLASDHDKPDGYWHVQEDQVREFLDPMPVGRLWGIGPRTRPRLNALGILTIGQLRRASEARLQPVLGNRTAHFMALARGEDERPVSASREDKSISHETTFEVDITSERILRARLLQLSEAVARRLRQSSLAGQTISVKIRDRHFQTFSRSRTLRASTHSGKTLYQVASALFDSWQATHRGTAVRLLGVGVSKLEPAPEARGVDATLDQAAQRFGEHALRRGASSPDENKPASSRNKDQAT